MEGSVKGVRGGSEHGGTAGGEGGWEQGKRRGKWSWGDTKNEKKCEGGGGEGYE